MHLSKRVIEMGWKQYESGTWEGVLTLVQGEKHRETSNTKLQVYQALSSNIFFWRKLALTRDLGFKCLVVDMA